MCQKTSLGFISELLYDIVISQNKVNKQIKLKQNMLTMPLRCSVSDTESHIVLFSTIFLLHGRSHIVDSK